MVLPLDVPFEIRAGEVHVSKVTRAVTHGLIVEMRGRRVAAFTAGGHGLRSHAIAKLDNRDKTISGIAVHFLRAVVRARAERRQRSPPGRRKANGNTRSGVTERLDDVAGHALEAIDAAPGRLPGAEVARKLVARQPTALADADRPMVVALSTDLLSPYTASEVATESTDHRRSHFRSSATWPANFTFRGFVRGARSHALTAPAFAVQTRAGSCRTPLPGAIRA